MSSNADNQRRNRPRQRDWAALAALLAAAAASGCALHTRQGASARAVPGVGAAIVDRSTCEGLYVQSIWKGEDISGPQCQSYAALEGSGEHYDPRRVRKVCEQTQIRTILSGEASTDFTLQACASHEPQYQQARLGKACRDISRVRTRRQEDLTPAQSAACKTHLERPGTSESRLASGAAPAPRWNGFASVPERSVAAARVAEVAPEAGDVAEQAAAAGSPAPITAAALPPAGTVAPAAVVAPAAAVAPVAVAPVAVAPAAVAPVAVAPVAVAPAAVVAAAPVVAPAVVAAAPVVAPAAVAAAPVVASSGAAPAAAESEGTRSAAARSAAARSERALCEDRLVESIWKGEDVTGGAACAAYASEYRLTRIQNVCEGAQIRSDRSGQPLPAFTLQTCQAALAPPSPPVAVAAAAPPAPAAPVEPDAAPGLDEKAIASTVDANWRSIGRDCSAVAPRSRTQEPLNVGVTVTLDVAATGQVQAVVVRARGYRELESCIENSVRSWVFPAAERGTEVGIPLVFAGQ